MFRSVDVLPVIWCSGKDFPGLGGDDAAVYVKASNLSVESRRGIFRHVHVYAALTQTYWKKLKRSKNDI